MPTARMSMAERASRQLKSGCVPEVVVRNLVMVGLGEEQARALVKDILAGRVSVTPAAAPRESIADLARGMLNMDTLTGLTFLAGGLMVLVFMVHRHIMFLTGFRFGVLLLMVGLWRTCVGILKQD